MRRPRSLVEVADLSIDSRAFWYNVMDFVDEVRRLRDPTLLVDPPPQLAGRFEDADVADCYLAAVAVALSRELGASPPVWVGQSYRTLRRPWFAHPGAALRATLLAESPAAFRERNLFVSANALSRA